MQSNFCGIVEANANLGWHPLLLLAPTVSQLDTLVTTTVTLNNIGYFFFLSIMRHFFPSLDPPDNFWNGEPYTLHPLWLTAERDNKERMSPEYTSQSGQEEEEGVCCTNETT